ncbi:uncharacterized protein BXIN_0788 [Babesia sp. Xinjiang]|uniref:uncharacterized protein n=1 Tax=Babesia sp. Xinjiang TaxID=462227 RepID=UPI000A25A0D4|nr:uncharacterized protein BXIN_0788 [Babesia sp. Xinjiang]ORM41346.1 hypothetical protein BXIN_0788 [Babesia sp. Xinjiang]
MVARLIVQPQAALRVFYDTIASLIPIPSSDKAAGHNNTMWLTQLSSISKVIENSFNSFKQAMMRQESNPREGEENVTRASMLQIKNGQRNEGEGGGRFVVESRSGGPAVESKTKEYVDPQPFQRNLESLVHIKSLSSVSEHCFYKNFDSGHFRRNYRYFASYCFFCHVKHLLILSKRAHIYC